MMGKDQPCFFELMQEIPSLLSQYLQTSLFVRLDGSDFENETCQFRYFFVGALRQLLHPGDILGGDVGLMELPVAYQTLVDSEVSDPRGQISIDKFPNIAHSFSFILLTQEAIWMRNKSGNGVRKPFV
jgi:hypothetical protein